MSAAPRPPLLSRVPPRAWTVLAWCGAAMFPFALFFTAVVEHRVGFGTPWVLPTLLMFLPAGLLRRRPLIALSLMLVALYAVTATTTTPVGYLWGGNNFPGTWYAQSVVVYFAVGLIAARHPRRISVLAAAMTLTIELGCGVTRMGLTPAGFLALALAAVWLTGHSIRQRREYAEATRRQAAVQAVQAERLRIARELHDMIGHSIGVIAIQAGVGSRVMDTQPEETRKALDVIEHTSRETLAGLRRMLGALRRAEQPAPLDPSPGLADLDGLAARSLNAGVHVAVQRQGRERALPADVDLSAFRVIQEAVTNVVRHAGTPRCRVSLDFRDDELSIEVTDDGKGGTPGTGYGIPGMRERVSLLHGDFSAGPRPEGGFRVAARIPVPAEAR